MSLSAPITLATAGHVDHGKTALVRALTGVETDRLPAERARGLTIEPGFAPLELAAGRVSLVDVPGHERFVRHMVAGASGVDGFLLCVAADDGVMPQTIEHLEVLRLLEIRRGVVAVTRSDLADPARAATEARALVGPEAEVVAVAAPLGDGLEALRVALERLVSGLERRTAPGRARLYVDRCFTRPGSGTVVTGTLWGAPVAVGARVRALPGGATARVRAIQVHDRAVERASGGRVALNLAGAARADVPRGSCVVREEDGWETIERLGVALEVLPGSPALRSRHRLQVFIGTAEVAATVVLREAPLAPGASGPADLRLARPLVAAAGDRVIARSAGRTVAGGAVVDADAGRQRRAARLSSAASVPVRRRPPPAPVGAEAVAAVLRAAGPKPPTPASIAAEVGLDEETARAALAALRAAGRAEGTDELTFDAEAVAAAERLAVDALRRGPLALGQLRDLWRVGRRHALALANLLDARGTTRRVGDLRHLRRGLTGS